MIKSVQVLRALAALMVVYFHLGDVAKVAHLPVVGSAGVDLFFVISGFVMTHTTYGHPVQPADFVRNRVSRIVPIYWVMTLAVFVLALVAPALLKATRADGLELLKSLLFIPFRKSNGLVEPVLFVGWTLNYEMFFYALFAASLALKRPDWSFYAVLTGLVALVLTGLVVRTDNVFFNFYTNPSILEFGLGMVIARILKAAPGSAALPIRCGVALGLLGLPVLFAAPVLLQGPRLLLAGVPAVIAVVSAVLLERWGWAVNSRPAMALGAASYSMYLCHPYITVVFERLTQRWWGVSFVPILVITVCLIVVCLLSFALYRWVGRPLSQAARRVLEVSRLQPQPA